MLGGGVFFGVGAHSAGSANEICFLIEYGF